MIVLGIETTCDETAAAVVERGADGRGRILSNVILSQIDDHAAFGGVVPEIAARAHVEALDHVIAKAMRDAASGFDTLDAVAAAAGPGLIGGVMVGLTAAKGLALKSRSCCRISAARRSGSWTISMTIRSCSPSLGAVVRSRCRRAQRDGQPRI